MSFSTTKLSLTVNFPVFMILLCAGVSGEEKKECYWIWKDNWLPDCQLVHMPITKSAIICLFCYSSPIPCEDACFGIKLLSFKLNQPKVGLLCLKPRCSSKACITLKKVAKLVN